MKESIYIKGAREHNLKNIDVEIPRNKLVVFTGLSGSGKSSLAFDTLFAEGQRRYIESLSAYARQFIGQMDKPDVDYIEGLSPAISIDQKTTSKNPRSTVGTVTEIYDYIRLLYARIGVPHCPKCKNNLKWYMNIPLLSYLFLRGKCAYCKEKISFQYPLVEFITAISYLGAFFAFGISLKLLFAWIFLALFIAMSATDFKETVIIDGQEVFMYNKERLLIELIRLQKRISFDYYKEIIANYRTISYELDMCKIEKYLTFFKESEKIFDVIQREVF